MARIAIQAVIEYDDKTMHGEDEESLKWFLEDILMDNIEAGLVVHSKETGDSIGKLEIHQLIYRNEETGKGKIIERTEE